MTKIAGKPVAMVFPLKLHGDPNHLPVDSRIQVAEVVSIKFETVLLELCSLPQPCFLFFLRGNYFNWSEDFFSMTKSLPDNFSNSLVL